MSSTTLLSLGNLSVWYTANHPVLSDFSLDLGTNEVVGLIGLNGAGKNDLYENRCRFIAELSSGQRRMERSAVSRSVIRRSSGADTLFLRKIGLFSISHSGNIWRMWLRLMAYRCQMCPGW